MYSITETNINQKQTLIDLYFQEIQILELLKNRKALGIKCSKKDGIKKQAMQKRKKKKSKQY